MVTALTLIEALREREEFASSLVRSPGDKRLPDPVAQRKTLQSLFRTEVDGMRRIARWATCPEAIPTWRMVLRQDVLLVNVRPVGLEEFVATHGMTPFTMARLAEEGRIVVNLHEYDADRKRSFADHEAALGTLAPLLVLERGCRIMYVRRDRFFDVLDLGPQRRNAEEAAITLFQAAVTTRSFHERFAASEDALRKFAENWSYLVCLAPGNSALEAWLDKVRDSDNESRITAFPQTLKQLNAWKHLFASPLIRAFGGTLILSNEEFRNACEWLGELEEVQTAGATPSGSTQLSLPPTRDAGVVVAHSSPQVVLSFEDLLRLGDELRDLRTRVEAAYDAWSVATDSGRERAQQRLDLARAEFDAAEFATLRGAKIHVPPLFDLAGPSNNNAEAARGHHEWFRLAHGGMVALRDMGLPFAHLSRVYLLSPPSGYRRRGP